MRKASLFAASCIALVAFLGLSGQAFAGTHDSACDAHGNAFGLYDFSVKTPDSPWQYQNSSVTGAGLFCGSDISWPSRGGGTLADHATITTAPGVAVNSTSGMANDSYAGHATVNILGFALTFPKFIPNVYSRLSIDGNTNCESENANLVGGALPGKVIACYKGVASGLLPGHNWNWTLQTNDGPDGTNTLVIGPFHNDLTGEAAGLTKISDFTLCEYAGSVGGSSCGTDVNQWLQRNGAGSVPGDCSDGNGIYTATVTNRNNQTTTPVTTCVPWKVPKGKKNIDQY